MQIRAINFANYIQERVNTATNSIPSQNDDLVHEVSRAVCRSFKDAYDGNYAEVDKIRPEAPLIAGSVRLEKSGVTLDNNDAMFGDGIVAKIRKFELGLPQENHFEEVRVFVGRKCHQHKAPGRETSQTYNNSQILLGVAYGDGKFDWKWEDVNEVPTAKNQLNQLQRKIREVVANALTQQ